MKNFILKNAISTAVILVLFIIIVNTTLIFYNKNKMVKSAQIRVETEAISTATKNLLNDVFHNIDLGVRAFGVTQNEAMLDPTYGGIGRIAPAFEELDKRLGAQSYPYMSDLGELKKAYDNYADFTKSMIEVAKKDSLQTFKEMMAEDRGLGLYLKYKDVSTKILNFESEEFKKATNEYETAQIWNMILQVILLIISLPTLGFVVFRIKKDEDTRNKILQDLEENNRKYIFNPGTDIGPLQPKEIIENSIENFKKASYFIKKMGNGDYATSWEGLNESNIKLNENNLAGELIKMKENLSQLKTQDEMRIWTNEGLSKFSEIVRNNQHDLKKLSDETVKYLAHYLNAQQVGLFVVQNEDREDLSLELTAAYAFGRKKFLEKSIDPGQGLVGQTYLEKETILLKEIPNGYTTITSGLGEATPKCLILVPIKYNETIEGVLEMASFNVFADHQINFLEKAGEFIASAMLGVKTSSKMKILLEETQQQSEESRAQEEIMRQNIEEMEAAQEEIGRQNQVTQNLLQDLQKKEHEMKKNVFGKQEEIEVLHAKINIYKKWKDLGDLDFKKAQKDFSNFKDFQTSGKNLTNLVNSLGDDFKGIALQLFKNFGFEEQVFDSKKWYALDKFLHINYFIVSFFGKEVSFEVGKATSASIMIPSNVKSVEQLLAGVNIHYHMDHAFNGKALFDQIENKYNNQFAIGGHHLVKEENGNLTLTVDTPYPQEMERGYLTALCRKIEPLAEVFIDFNRPQRDKGDKSTTYIIKF